MTDLTLIVRRAEDAGELIREIELGPSDDGTLPPFQAGAHIILALPDGGENAYSLIDLDGDPSAPTSYVLGIRRDDAGAGGSRFMHDLKPGDSVTASLPKNHFQLDPGDAPVLLLAGGIGVTPLISMAAALARQGRAFRMIYASRSPEAAAFADRLTAAHGDLLTLHHDTRDGGPLDVAAVISDLDPAAHVYVCGPKPMIDATRAAMDAAGRADTQFHAELFENASHEAGDKPFEVEIASTGQIITVPADQTIIEALEAAGVDLIYDCQRGDCGICQTEVLEGIPDHRDVVLSKDERASGKVMQICVSRALSPRLKLDL
ncbi:oxidoreductase [Paracoccus aurantiacus]|uniref:Oxidoreductase n=1 Tax=Paracoccus aurantiacus TaxID=2599412 RepID=A0A5C6S016_9RHOB|nr:PDR/VanB family oxidoreductase [Paracoccus aurantiacus]TXB67707.1 oxidoreductase [Paracoccus aurantiacus]